MIDPALTITAKSRRRLEFEFEGVNCNLQDTILIPTQVDRNTPLEDMGLMDFGLVRYSDIFQLRYAGIISMRFLQTWNDDDMYFENWAHWSKRERITMEDIYTILSEIDAFGAKAPGDRGEHAAFMTNMTKMRDFVAFVADQERKVADDEKAKEEISAGKEELGIAAK